MERPCLCLLYVDQQQSILGNNRNLFCFLRFLHQQDRRVSHRKNITSLRQILCNVLLLIVNPERLGYCHITHMNEIMAGLSTALLPIFVRLYIIPSVTIETPPQTSCLIRLIFFYNKQFVILCQYLFFWLNYSD